MKQGYLHVKHTQQGSNMCESTYAMTKARFRRMQPAKNPAYEPYKTASSEASKPKKVLFFAGFGGAAASCHQPAHIHVKNQSLRNRLQVCRTPHGKAQRVSVKHRKFDGHHASWIRADMYLFAMLLWRSTRRAEVGHLDGDRLRDRGRRQANLDHALRDGGGRDAVCDRSDVA